MSNSLNKQLVTMQDLAQGVGTVNQDRNGTNYELGKVALPYGVANEAELKSLDVTKFSLARIFGSNGTIEYYYDEADESGIKPTAGPGSWLVLRPLAPAVLDRRYATLSEALLDSTLVEGNKVVTRGYSTTNDLGGCSYVVEPLVDADGYKNHETVNGLQLTMIVPTVANPRMFGAKTLTDDTLAVQACFDSASHTEISEIYPVVEVYSTGYVTCTGEGGLLFVGDVDPVTSVVKTLFEARSHFGTLNLDGGLKDVKCFSHETARLTLGDYINTKNVRATLKTPAANLSCGVICTAGILDVGGIRGDNSLNDGHTNDSFPQLVVGGGEDTDLIVNSVKANNCQAGIVNSQVVRSVVRVANAVLTNMGDNGVYNLVGTTHVGSLTYEGNEEPIVNKDTLYVDTVRCIGRCFRVVAVEKSVLTEIGHIIGAVKEGETDYANNTPRGIYGHRSGNTGYSAGRVSIGKVSGDFCESLIRTGFGSGDTEFLAIGEIDVNLHAEKGAIDLGNWMNLSGCLGFRLPKSNINIIDTLGTFTSSEYFTDLFVSTTYLSEITNFDIYFQNNDRTVNDTMQYRGLRALGETLTIRGAIWQTNTSTPYRKQQTALLGSLRDATYSNLAPTKGYWQQGQELNNVTWNGTSITTIAFRCIVTGVDAGATWVPIVS